MALPEGGFFVETGDDVTITVVTLQVILLPEQKGTYCEVDGFGVGCGLLILDPVYNGIYKP